MENLTDGFMDEVLKLDQHRDCLAEATAEKQDSDVVMVVCPCPQCTPRC